MAGTWTTRPTPPRGWSPGPDARSPSSPRGPGTMRPGMTRVPSRRVPNRIPEGRFRGSPARSRPPSRDHQRRDTALDRRRHRPIPDPDAAPAQGTPGRGQRHGVAQGPQGDVREEEHLRPRVRPGAGRCRPIRPIGADEPTHRHDPDLRRQRRHAQPPSARRCWHPMSARAGARASGAVQGSISGCAYAMYRMVLARGRRGRTHSPPPTGGVDARSPNLVAWTVPSQ